MHFYMGGLWSWNWRARVADYLLNDTQAWEVGVSLLMYIFMIGPGL